jgi:hypothetical protein
MTRQALADPTGYLIVHVEPASLRQLFLRSSLSSSPTDGALGITGIKKLATAAERRAAKRRRAKQEN